VKARSGGWAVRRADREDYDWLFRASYPRIRRTVASIVRSPEIAEDITQEAFFKLLQEWRTVSAFDRPDAWVRRVAIRLAVRYVTRESGRAAVEATARTLPPPASDVDLGNAIAVLPPMQRAAVVMHYFDDLPVADVARILVVSESTVKQHLYRARHRLADLLGEEVAADDVHR
jgi:RNA polymerase sigma factor (sigma-70 family)